MIQSRRRRKHVNAARNSSAVCVAKQIPPPQKKEPDENSEGSLDPIRRKTWQISVALGQNLTWCVAGEGVGHRTSRPARGRGRRRGGGRQRRGQRQRAPDETSRRNLGTGKDNGRKNRVASTCASFITKEPCVLARRWRRRRRRRRRRKKSPKTVGRDGWLGVLWPPTSLIGGPSTGLVRSCRPPIGRCRCPRKPGKTRYHPAPKLKSTAEESRGGGRG